MNIRSALVFSVLLVLSAGDRLAAETPGSDAAKTTPATSAIATVDGATLRVEVPAEDGAWQFSEIEGYAAALEALKNNTVTEFRKSGGGRLVVGDDISAYRGNLYVDEGTYSFEVIGACGAHALNDEKGSTYVADGATLDCALGSVSNGNISYRKVYFRGTGVDGKGALTASTVFDHEKSIWSEYLIMEGDALISDLTCPNDNGCNLILTSAYSSTDRYSYLDMNGHKLTVRMKGNGAKYCQIKFEGRILNAGHIDLFGAVWYSTEYVSYGNTSGKTFFAGPGSGILYKNSRGSNPNYALIYSNDISSAGFRSTGTQIKSGNRTWGGPVKLETTMPISIVDGSDLTFRGSITGPGGLCVSSTSDVASGRRGALYLEKDCDFAGDFASTNTSVIFTGSAASMNVGDGFFHSNGSFEGGSGSWRHRLVKTGDGTLNYDSLIGAERLEIAGGGVALGGTTFEQWLIKGLVVGRKFAPSWGELRDLFMDTTTVFTNDIQNGFNAANNWSDPAWKHSEGEPYDKHMLVTYSGYLCNETAQTVRWSFLLCCVSKAHLIVDGTHSLLQETYKEAQKMTLDIAPGRHKVVLKIYAVYTSTEISTPGGGPAAAATNVVKAANESVGLRIDVKGRDSWTLSDYAELTDSDGSFFRWSAADPGEENPVHPLTGNGLYDIFRSVCAKPGTSIDFAKPIERRFETFEGFTAMSGQSDIVLSGGWDIDAALLKNVGETGGWTTDGKVTFLDGAKIRIAGVPAPKRASDPGELVILDAAGGIAGSYEVEMDEAVSERWCFSAADDGKRLLLKHKPKGLRIFVK